MLSWDSKHPCEALPARKAYPAEYGRLARAEIQGYRCQVNEGIALYDRWASSRGAFPRGQRERAGQ